MPSPIPKPRQKYNRKPSEKQLKTFQHLKTARSLQEAMLKGGYSRQTSTHPDRNFLSLEGTKTLIEQYKDQLYEAGASPAILAEIEVAGLFEENGAIRLGYLKEVKKSLGLNNEAAVATAVQINFNNHTQQELKEFE